MAIIGDNLLTRTAGNLRVGHCVGVVRLLNMAASRHIRSKQVFRKAQPELFVGDIRDKLEENSAAIWLKNNLHRIDISEVKALFPVHGGVPYDPSRMLGIILLGVMVRITSSRALEDACRYDLRFMLVADNETPDYRTIGRFRARLAPVIGALFTQVVRLAIEDGLVQLGRISIDSTKVASASSQARKWMKAATQEDLDEDAQEPYSDPEAPVRKTSKGPLRGYTVQAAVDVDTGIVVAADVTTEANDRLALGSMVEQVIEITGAIPGEVLADRGYDTYEGHARLEDQGIAGFIPPQTHEAGFWQEADGQVVCPMGHPALPYSARIERGRLIEVHQVRACQSCVLKASCCPRSRGRTLTVPAGVNPLPRIHAIWLNSTPAGDEARRDRLGSIESVFGYLKWNCKSPRLSMRGLDKVKVEVLLKLMGKNLNRLVAAIFGLFWVCFGAINPKTLRHLPKMRSAIATPRPHAA